MKNLHFALDKSAGKLLAQVAHFNKRKVNLIR